MNDMPCPCTKDCPRRNSYICRKTCDEFKEYEKVHSQFLKERYNIIEEKRKYTEYIKQSKKRMKRGKKK